MKPEQRPPDAFLRAIEAFQRSMSLNHVEQAEAAALEALRLAAEEMGQNRTPESALRAEAGQCEQRGDWAGAEACYRKLMALQEVTGNPGLICKAAYDLSRHFLLLGDLEQADQFARASVTAARRTGIVPLQVMVLEHLARCALRRSDPQSALQAASEAVTLVEPWPANDGIRAGALVVRARCQVALKGLAAAEADLEASRAILVETEISPIFAGTQAKAGAWWEAWAELCAQRGEAEAAATAWGQAVQKRRHVASLDHVAGPHTLEALSRTLRHYGEALLAVGKTSHGEKACVEAQHLWSELGLSAGL